MTSGTQLQPLDDQIAITGMGVVSPIGQGIEVFWAGLVNGVSGITTLERWLLLDSGVLHSMDRT
jgi:3-oxoacyl-(acyl-carrier-protein) synthase